MECKTRFAPALLLSLLLTGCTFNPFTRDNDLTGSALSTGIGAGAGVGAAAIINGSSKTGPLIWGGVVGAAIGYYVSTLRFASGGVIQSGGQVFALGDFVTIDMPNDSLFDSNSADFTDNAELILDSAVAVLKRFPNDNIIVSGNSSGAGMTRLENKLSQARARQVAAYLWAHGIGDYRFQSLDRRKLTYVGYGNYFPIANTIHNNSIRQNSRIQITAYPTAAQLEIEKRMKQFNNIGSLGEPLCSTDTEHTNFGNEFSEVLRERPSSNRNDFGAYSEGHIDNSIKSASSQHSDYYHETGRTSDTSIWKNPGASNSSARTVAFNNIENQPGL